MMKTKRAPVHRIGPVLVLALLVLVSLRALAQSNSAPAPPSAAADKQADGKHADEKQSQGSRAAHSDNSYVIGADDVLAINVWKEPEVSRSVPVRSDGKISLPLVGELMAGGI